MNVVGIGVLLAAVVAVSAASCHGAAPCDG